MLLRKASNDLDRVKDAPWVTADGLIEMRCLKGWYGAYDWSVTAKFRQYVREYESC